VRAVHEKLSRLLTEQERHELRMQDAFTAFSNLNPVQYNPYTQPLWAAAVAQFDRAVAPAEQRIAGKLRAQIRGLEGNSQQLLREFQRYRELIRRPNLAKELMTERCALYTVYMISVQFSCLFSFVYECIFSALTVLLILI